MFIAQYILIPINTIVDKYFLKMFFANTPEHKIHGKDGKFLKKFWARRLKVKFYLQYTLFVEIIGIVKKYGRDDKYNFSLDDRLSKILQGNYGFNTANDKRQNTLSLDSFMTIWLVTLPEKFKK